jgi:hypothetical protein
MTVIQNSVFQILEIFPDCSNAIKRLYKTNRKFQSVCEDYRVCAEALQHWNHSNKKEALVRRQEYEQLLQELVDEIRLFMNKSN